jgi:hypothetical protein
VKRKYILRKKRWKEGGKKMGQQRKNGRTKRGENMGNRMV